jgi:hypothetical protein
MFLFAQRSLRGVAGFCATCLLACTLSSGNAKADQIVNGNFTSGDVGFTSGYALVPANGTVHTGPGEFGLTTNPAVGFTNGYTSYTDHTGNAGGLMLFADGYYAGTNVWAETVSVTPSTTYTFTGWVASAYPENVAVLGLFANGSQVGSSFAAPTSAGVWTEWTKTIITGSAVSSIALSIQDLNPSVYVAGDDFTLDDLSLVGTTSMPISPEPSTLGLGALALIGLGAVKLIRFRSLKPFVS